MILGTNPYDKSGGDVTVGSAIGILGFSAGVQKTCGEDTPQTAFICLYILIRGKTPYHTYKTYIGYCRCSDPNSNHHEDGYNTIGFIKISGLENMI